MASARGSRGRLAAAALFGAGFFAGRSSQPPREVNINSTFGGFISAETFNRVATDARCQIEVRDGDLVQPAYNKLAACLRRRQCERE